MSRSYISSPSWRLHGVVGELYFNYKIWQYKTSRSCVSFHVLGREYDALPGYAPSTIFSRIPHGHFWEVGEWVCATYSRTNILTLLSFAI
jgi:hypothetical protein